MKVHAYDFSMPRRAMGTRPISICGRVGGHSSMDYSRVTCERCLRSLKKKGAA